MRAFRFSLTGGCAVALATALQAGIAQAAIVTQTVGVPAQNLFTAATFASAPLSVASSLNAFDARLGALRAVSVAYTDDRAPAVVDVPKPPALALVLLSGTALALQRRRTRVRLMPPALPALT